MLWLALLVLSLAGLVIALILLRIHYKVHTDVDFRSFCGRGSRLNCDVVARSPYSIVAGVPLAAWGVLGYLLSAGLAVWGLRARRDPVLPAGAGVMLTAMYLAGSASLMALSTLRIGVFCPLCTVTYGINLLLFFAATIQAGSVGFRAALARPWRVLRERPLPGGLALAALVGVLLVTVAAYPEYWRRGSALGIPLPVESSLPHGDSGDGHWIGAENPVLTIVEFSDYECPFCRQAHAQLRAKVQAHASRLRLVHRHFPLDQACNPDIDQPFHQQACRAALIAECAGRAGRFWQANDYLYEEARWLRSKSDRQVALDLGLDPAELSRCMSEHGRRAIERDVQEGIRLRLQGTPSFVIDGQVHMGSIPVGALDALKAEPEAGAAPR